MLTPNQRFNVVSNANHARLWYEALCSKYHNRGKVWTREDYDQLLGDFHATTDVPCSFFAMDLIRAYPEAKVILNKREFNAWHKSVVVNLDQILKSWFFAIFMRLEQGLLDIYRIFFNMYNIHFAGDLARNGRVTYEEHCALVRGAMADRKEEFLEWEVTDGWGPLCKFLELPVPKEPFPSGNATAEFDKRIQSSTVKRFRKALRNLVILVVLAIVGVLWAFGLISPPGWVDLVSRK